MSLEFGVKSGKSMLEILVAGDSKRGLGGRGRGGGAVFLVKITNGRCNSLKWLAFPKF